MHGRERFFLYVHLMDVHQYLYDTKSAVFGASYSDIYDNSVLHTDAVIGRLLTIFANQGLLEKTIVVLAADHGEAFGERGIEGHAREVFRRGDRDPVHHRIPVPPREGRRRGTRSRNVDVWPTLLDLLGLPSLPDADGRSLVPEIIAAARGAEAPDDQPAFSHLERGWGRPESPSRPDGGGDEGEPIASSCSSRPDSVARSARRMAVRWSKRIPPSGRT